MLTESPCDWALKINYLSIYHRVTKLVPPSHSCTLAPIAGRQRSLLVHFLAVGHEDYRLGVCVCVYFGGPRGMITGTKVNTVGKIDRKRDYSA